MVQRDGNDGKATPGACEGMTWAHRRIVRVEHDVAFQFIWLEDDAIAYAVPNALRRNVTIRIGDTASVYGVWDTALGHLVGYRLVIGECQVW